MKVAPYYPVAVLCAAGHLDPFQVTENVELGFSWIAEILNSGYPEDDRYWMASSVVQLLGNHFQQEDPVRQLHVVQPTEVPPLLDFLLLCEKFYDTEPYATKPSHPGFIAFYILSTSREYTDFGPTILHVFSLTLLPTHPLQSRILALAAFHMLMPGWFSTQMENALYKNLDSLLQAVGDPFQFPQLPKSGEAGPEWRPDYKPMNSVVVLIEFASSDLWRNHLRHSNFTSCEEALSTEEGRSTAIHCMFDTAYFIWRAFLHTPAKIVAAIRRLEELQCLNTAEVVIMWAWTVGVMDPVDHDGWELIGGETLRFYQTHGIGRFTTLKRHIINTTTESKHLWSLRKHYEGSLCRIGVPFTRPPLGQLSPSDWSDLCVSRVCQLRRLHHLFGYDPTTWKEAVAAGEAVAVEEVDEEMDVSPGHPVPFVDWACDYP